MSETVRVLTAPRILLTGTRVLADGTGASVETDLDWTNVTSTSGSTGGTAVTTGTTKSTALTDDIDLIPYNGIEANAGAAEALNTHYICMSRNVYE